MFRPNRMKARLRAGEQLIGTWLQSGSATFAEMAAIAGYDLFIMDQEHGMGDLQAAVDSMRAARSSMSVRSWLLWANGGSPGRGSTSSSGSRYRWTILFFRRRTSS